MKRVYSGIGGQAVIEGIMMKNKDEYATAVRKPNGEIACEKGEGKSITEKYKFFALPFVRGAVSLIESLALGMKTLEISANYFAEDDGNQEEPTKFEKWLEEKVPEKAENIIMTISMVIAVAFAIGIFVILPTALIGLLKKQITSPSLIALLEGVLRLAIFIGYILLVSQMKDIKRTFMYHGAEHKCINCVELGLPLTVDNVMASSKEHKRCGTSFLFIVMAISIVFFMVVRIGNDNIFLRILVRIVMIPVIAGISYEFLRIAGRSENCIVNILSRPGLWMQGLTTKEPTPDMCEVAITATEAVFDWKKFLLENFPENDYDFS